MSPKPIKVGSITGVWSFVASVDWEERWLWAVVGFHVMCLTITLLSHGRHNIQATLFVIFLGLVYFAEQVNEIAAENYTYFSQQQYFDSNGLFISIMWSIPLIVNCCIMVVSWLWTSYHLLVVVKRKELRYNAKQAAQKEK